MELSNTNMKIALKLASEQCLNDDVEELNAIDISEINVSDKTSRRIRRANFWNKTEGFRKGFAVFIKKTVACFIVMCAVLFTIAMSIKTVRAAFWEAIVTWYDNYIGIHVETTEDERTLETIGNVSLSSIVPDGWIVEEVLHNTISAIYYLYDDSGKVIIYHQIINNGSDFWIDNFDCSIEAVTVGNNLKGYLVTYPDERCILWWEDQDIFSLESENIPYNTILNLANTIASQNGN